MGMRNVRTVEHNFGRSWGSPSTLMPEEKRSGRRKRRRGRRRIQGVGLIWLSVCTSGGLL